MELFSLQIKKVSAADCSEYDYENKLVGEIRHVIFGASGSSEMFQLYRGMAMDYVNSHPGEITFRNAIYKLSALAFELYKRYDFSPNYYNEVSVPTKPPDIPSNLTYIRGNGMPCTIDACVAIGSGSPFAKMFMKRVWHLGYPWSKWQS